VKLIGEFDATDTVKVLPVSFVLEFEAADLRALGVA
jgi:hypothetical protein